MLSIDDLFKGRHFDREIIILCVRWYLRFKLSFRDLVEMMVERGISLAHTTIMRWIQRYVPEFEKRWNRFAQIDPAHRHPVALRFDVDIAVRRGLHRGDQRIAAALALKAAELFGRDDNDLVASMHGDVLRAFATHTPHQLAKASLGVLKQPVTRQQPARATHGFLGASGRGKDFLSSSHTD